MSLRPSCWRCVAAGARVRVVAPVGARGDRAGTSVEIVRRGFVPSDLDGAWLVVAAATPEVNREVAAAAEPRRVFVNAVDDPANASAFLSGMVRRDGVTMAVSTSGDAPALTALRAGGARRAAPGTTSIAGWRKRGGSGRSGGAIGCRWQRPQAARCLQALNGLYQARPEGQALDECAPGGQTVACSPGLTVGMCRSSAPGPAIRRCSRGRRSRACARPTWCCTMR